MAIEIEHKFMVKSDSWKRSAGNPRSLRQAYLSRDGNCAVRVRIDNGEKAWLTIKSATSGSVRKEFEYDIPVTDAEDLMQMATGSVIEKVRYTLPDGVLTWEIDVFSGDNEGLVIAEIELDYEGQAFAKPEWLGEDVTAEKRYYNSNLSQYPFKEWND